MASIRAINKESLNQNTVGEFVEHFTLLLFNNKSELCMHPLDVIKWIQMNTNPNFIYM